MQKENETEYESDSSNDTDSITSEQQEKIENEFDNAMAMAKKTEEPKLPVLVVQQEAKKEKNKSKQETKKKTTTELADNKLAKLKSKLNGFNCEASLQLNEIINRNLCIIAPPPPSNRLTTRKLIALKKQIETEFQDSIGEELIKVINHSIAVEKIKEDAKKEDYRNEIVNCEICDKEVKRRSLYFHKKLHKNTLLAEEIKDLSLTNDEIDINLNEMA
jgi:intracellular sulfur oxidation DsrE/DsrF family protein